MQWKRSMRNTSRTAMDGMQLWTTYTSILLLLFAGTFPCCHLADAFCQPSSFSLKCSRLYSTATETAADAIGDDTQSLSSTVEVWDGVFSAEVCGYLHELAIDHSERTTSEEDDYDDEDDGEMRIRDDDEEDDEDEDGLEDEEEDDSLDGSSTFIHRRTKPTGDEQQQRDRLTPLEQALDSFLEAYYAKSENTADAFAKDIVVEYWCRQEHLNLEAHADVDEVFFERHCMNHPNANTENTSGFRYPTMGHVLYLTRPTLGRGPTCVFPPTGQASTDIADEISSVVTIPAVPGRVLRFPGNALHAVPKPAGVWFSESMDDVTEETDDDDDDDDDAERSVVLFNTWEETTTGTTDGEIVGGPTGVPKDPMFEAQTDLELVEMMMSSVDMDDGLEVDEAFVKGMVEYAKQQRNEVLQKWRINYSDENETTSDYDSPLVYSRVHCRPSESWKAASIEQSAKDDGNAPLGMIRVPLMGDETRRRYPKKAIRWAVPSTFQEGVKDSEAPFEFPLFVVESQN